MKLGNGVVREAPSKPPTYTYAGIGYANPHAPTQIGNGLSTTSFAYDNNGNLAQKTTDGVTTTYLWDYANRLIALGVAGQGTSTYGYDAFGARVYQITASTSAPTTYPFKFYSIASTTKSSTNFATSTEYIFNGDTLLATVDRAFRNGAATGTAQTRYIHPDHLGSTNVVTNASGTVVQILDYYPYGAPRISTNVGGADSARKFIGQFADQSNLDYLNARYYESARGQFISQDPTFLAIGNPSQLAQLTKQNPWSLLMNPQALNSYSYAKGNPIINKDPDGLWYIPVPLSPPTATGPFSVSAGVGINNVGIGGYFSAGIGFGLLANLGLFNTGSMNLYRPETVVSRDATFAAGPSITGQFQGIFDPSSPLQVKNGQWSYEVGAGMGGRIGQSYMMTTPIYRFDPAKYFSNANTVQARYSATQSYNSNAGASTPQDKVWTTPNGAVVKWDGTVVAPAPQQSSQSSNASTKKP